METNLELQNDEQGNLEEKPLSMPTATFTTLNTTEALITENKRLRGEIAWLRAQLALLQQRALKFEAGISGETTNSKQFTGKEWSSYVQRSGNHMRLTKGQQAALRAKEQFDICYDEQLEYYHGELSPISVKIETEDETAPIPSNKHAWEFLTAPPTAKRPRKEAQ